MPTISEHLILAARELSTQVNHLKFAPPVAYVYNPLTYAWPAHEEYLRRYGNTKKRVVFLGMNPGPFGMTQTGIPFGEIAAVRDWLGIHAKIGRPDVEHPKRPILGFDCPNSEVSGRRLWKLFADRFGSPEKFFRDHFVANYCPLVFCEDSGRNRTPDKLPAGEREALFAACDAHLRRVLEILQPEWFIGIGAFAFLRAQLAVSICHPTSAESSTTNKTAKRRTLLPPLLGERAGVRAELGQNHSNIRLGQILHPSPASPAANRGDWGVTVTKQLVKLGVWE